MFFYPTTVQYPTIYRFLYTETDTCLRYIRASRNPPAGRCPIFFVSPRKCSWSRPPSADRPPPSRAPACIRSPVPYKSSPRTLSSLAAGRDRPCRPPSRCRSRPRAWYRRFALPPARASLQGGCPGCGGFGLCNYPDFGGIRTASPPSEHVVRKEYRRGKGGYEEFLQ